MKAGEFSLISHNPYMKEAGILQLPRRNRVLGLFFVFRRVFSFLIYFSYHQLDQKFHLIYTASRSSARIVRREEVFR